MPKIGVKEDLKTKNVKSSADEKKENAKKVIGTEKGKANQTKKAKIQDIDTPKSKTRKTPKEKIVAKKDVSNVEKVAKTTKKVASKKKTEVKKETPKTTRAKKTIVSDKTEKNKKTTAKKSVTKTSKKDTKKIKLEKILNPKSKKKVATKKTTEKTYLPEYYDLPYRYNDTIVRILYQTPKRIFVYWDVSDSDRQRYLRAFGENFFEKTYPVLLVHNEELNYTFEVPINDFANSWYLDINDSKNKYVVQLGRKFKDIQKEEINYEIVQEEKINLQNDFVYITDSNKLETPNDHILFEKIPEKIVYKNIKTGEIIEKEVKQILKPLSKIYDNPQVEDLYEELYGEEILMEELDISNPSSGGSSSFIK